MTRLERWMYMRCGVHLWSCRKPTSRALNAYPYFYIDLVAAWERAGANGAREVIAEANRRLDYKYTVLASIDDIPFGEYPDGLSVRAITDSGEMSAGYKRRWETGDFTYHSEAVSEIIWHIHDGYGLEAGRIECTIYR